MSVDAATTDSASPEVPSPSSHTNDSIDESLETIQPASDAKAQNGKPAGQFPAPQKTDKPRPHVCTNCGRAFARLEHLKRHERSHTKEKPFECPECARCFARRDLLLRHQQKLHFAPNTSKPRANRRDSVSAASTTSRVRKNSVATSTGSGHALKQGGPRPRANTVGHLDLSSLGQYSRVLGPRTADPSHRMSMGGVPGAGSIDYSLSDVSSGHQLQRIDTRHTVDVPLQTAPPYSGGNPFDYDSLFPPNEAGDTVNPAQLHFGSASVPQLPTFDGQSQLNTSSMPDDDFSWMRNWSLDQMHLLAGDDFAIDESSPPAFVDGSMGPPPHDATINTGPVDMNMSWMSGDLELHNLMHSSGIFLNANQAFSKVDSHMTGISPNPMQDSPAADSLFSQQYAQMSSPGGFANGVPIAASVSNFDSDSPSMASSMTGSARQSSVTSVSTNSITDATRMALIMSLSQPSVFGHNHRKFSQPSISSPLSPSVANKTGPNLPSTSDLQRYVNAYIQYFHPHLPFLHIPTLSFDSPDYVSNIRPATMQAYNNYSGGMIGGGGCLILAMAAIGALYEYDFGPSKELFDSAKRMIQLYLEERRKADMSAAVNGLQSNGGSTSNNTPLWLVQAMLLNVIYGHHCSDKQSSDIASTHCAALVSLARAADLTQAAPSKHDARGMSEDGSSPANDGQSSAHSAWLKWKDAEERKRTLFAVFIVSSLLVTAYNHAPAIMNSEISLDLPCEEPLWSAENVNDWSARGGSHADEQNALPFASALSNLLTANTRSTATLSGWQPNNGNRLGGRQDMRPSTFGCFVLINALHNFIWETRSRHHSRQWTAKETESMISHIEPALNAWQAAWKANEHHHIQRPNPFGMGPLSADSIPLLDLAFVRLFVNLGRSKEAFWQRDFEAMANEFARGADIAQHAEGSPEAMASDPSGRQGVRRPSQILTTGQGSKREKYLRRAAFYAADSLSISTKCSLTFADPSAHELPIQSALCFFDCGQVLAEWAATVQERVGRYLGVLGREDIDFSQVPAIMLLETEDIELLTKLDNVCQMLEEKLVRQQTSYTADFALLDPATGMPFAQQQDSIPALRGIGYGAKVLKAIALTLEKPIAWPVTRVMAAALDVQAEHMTKRAEASLTAFS